MKKTVMLILTGCLLLSGCIHLVNEESPIDQVLKELPQATCPPCPTCPACPTCDTPPTATPPPTSTPTPQTNPPTQVPPTLTPATPTSTVTAPKYLYTLQSSNPVYSQNFTHPIEGCNWTGVSGQVFNKSNLPITNLVIHVWGTIGPSSIDSVALTGHPEGIEYGPGGYEITLTNSLLASTEPLNIQLLDLNAQPLSAVYQFFVQSNCAQNLSIINFIPNP